MNTPYSEHAAYWDWDAFEDIAEQQFWYVMSGRYGKKVLSCMCALGKTAAYLARQGCHVTALDLTREMILEGKNGTVHCPVFNLCREISATFA